MIITEERRQQLIADCKKEMSEIEKCLTTWGEVWRPSLQSKLERQQISLAALEAKPFDTIRVFGDVEQGTYVRCDADDDRAIVAYLAPPVPVMKPISPPSTECRGWVKEAIQEHDEKWKAAIRAAVYEIKGGEL